MLLESLEFEINNAIKRISFEIAWYFSVVVACQQKQRRFLYAACVPVYFRECCRLETDLRTQAGSGVAETRRELSVSAINAFDIQGV